MKRYEFRARIVKALAHPVRLWIVDRLQKREVCVNDLAEETGLDQSTVSHHLSLLTEAGILASRREGRMILYRVSCGCLEGFFHCIENLLSCDLEERKQALRRVRR